MINQLIEELFAVDGARARWLNTMSFLEYVGFRKIVKCQDAREMTADMLRHAAEESRHALLMKRLAIKAGGSNFKGYERETLLCGDEAEAYFQNVDRETAELLGPAAKTIDVYLAVTWLIEVRALAVYAAYDRGCRQRGLVSGVEGLIAEETRHLAEAERALESVAPTWLRVKTKLIEMEERACQRLLSAMSAEVACAVAV